MKNELVLSLDISTKTGWALIESTPEGPILKAYGVEKPISEPDGEYPSNYVYWADMCFNKIMWLITEYSPDALVIEETGKGSKNVYSQKILEYIHFLVASHVAETKIKAIYVMSGTWRSETGCVMTKDEKLKNKEVRAYKAKNETKIAYDISGKRIGIVGKKHVGVRRANEVFGKSLSKPLIRKDEDIADSLMLAYCYHLRRMRFV